MKVVTTKKTVEVDVTTYVALDGIEFPTLTLCRDHEKDIFFEKVRKIERCKLLDDYQNFDGTDHYFDNSYDWYLPKTQEECDLLAAYYENDIDFTPFIGEWICVESSGSGDAWVTTLSDAIAYAKEVLEKLGYHMEVHEK